MPEIIFVGGWKSKSNIYNNKETVLTFGPKTRINVTVTVSWHRRKYIRNK